MRVSDILDLLASGASEREILEDYAFLVQDDIRAALAFAAENIKNATNSTNFKPW